MVAMDKPRGQRLFTAVDTVFVSMFILPWSGQVPEKGPRDWWKGQGQHLHSGKKFPGRPEGPGHQRLWVAPQHMAEPSGFSPQENPLPALTDVNVPGGE